MARNYKRIRVWFSDEAIAIGSGVRLVEVFEGRKWVYLKRPDAPRVQAKLRAGDWRTLMATRGNRYLAAQREAA